MTLAATRDRVAALLGRTPPQDLEKRNPWWSQQPRDEYGKWTAGFVSGAFSPIGHGGGKPAEGQTAPNVTEPGTLTGVGGAMHGQHGWQGAGSAEQPLAGAPAGSHKWTIPEQIAQAKQEAHVAHQAAVAATKKPNGAGKKPSSGGYAHPKDWKQTGPQGGTNPGGVFTDAAGKKHYVKFYGDENQGKSEVLANSIYRALGINAPESRNVIIDGKKGVESPLIDNVKPSAGAHELKAHPDVLAGFVADAFLGNHDVVGQAYDNIVTGDDGKAHRIDNGGSMFHRAMGKPKPFSPKEVSEVDSMRDSNIAQQAGKVFDGLSDAEMMAQAKKLVKQLPDEKIAQLVASAGITGDDAEKYSAALIGRRNVLAQRFLSAADEAKEPTTADLAQNGMNAPAPVEPPAKPDPSPIVDPKHPHPDLLAMDPGLKSYAVADIVHNASSSVGNHAKAVAAAKKPKVLDKILSGQYHDKDVAQVLSGVTQKATNSPAHIELNKNGTWAVKQGPKDVDAAPAPGDFSAPLGSAQYHAAVMQAVNDPSVPAADHDDAMGALIAWQKKGANAADVKAMQKDPGFAKALLDKKYLSASAAQAGGGLLEHLTGAAVSYNMDAYGSTQLTLKNHGDVTNMPQGKWSGYDQGFPNPASVADGGGQFPHMLGFMPKSMDELQQKITDHSLDGNSAAVDWLKEYGKTAFPANTTENVKSAPKFTTEQIQNSYPESGGGGIPDSVWSNAIDKPTEVPESQQNAAANAILSSPKYLHHLAGTNYETAEQAEAAASLLEEATGDKWETHGDAGDFTLSPTQSPQADPAKPSEQAKPTYTTPDGKIDAMQIMHQPPPGSNKYVNAIGSKKVATKNLKSQLQGLAKTQSGIHDMLAAKYAKLNVAYAAKWALNNGGLGQGVTVAGSSGGGFHLVVNNGTGKYVPHPNNGISMHAAPVPSPAAAAAPVQPAEPPKPFVSEASNAFNAQEGPLSHDAPAAGIAGLSNEQLTGKLPAGVTRDMALTTDQEAQSKHVGSLESSGHVAAADWLRDRYMHVRNEPANPSAAGNQLYVGSHKNLPNYFKTASEVISDIHQSGATRPAGLNDWMLHANTPQERSAALNQLQSQAQYGKGAKAWLDRFYHARDEASAGDHHYNSEQLANMGLPEHAHPSFAQAPTPLAAQPSYHFHAGASSAKPHLSIGDVQKQTAPAYTNSNVAQPPGSTHLALKPNTSFSEAAMSVGVAAKANIAKFAKAQSNAPNAALDPIGDRPAEGVHKDSIHAFKETQAHFPAMLQAARASLPSREAIDSIAKLQGQRAALRQFAAAAAAPIMQHYGVTPDEYAHISNSIGSWTSSTTGADQNNPTANRLRVMSNMLRGRRPDENVFRNAELEKLSPQEARTFAKSVPAGAFRAFLVHKAVSQAMFERFADPKTGTATLKRGIGTDVAKTMAGKAGAEGLFNGGLGKTVQSHEMTLSGYTIRSPIANKFGGGGVLSREVRPEEVWHGQFLSPSQGSFDNEAEIFVASNGGGPKFMVASGPLPGYGNFITPKSAHSPAAFSGISGFDKIRKNLGGNPMESEQHLPATKDEWYAPAPEGWMPTPAAIEALRAAFTDEHGVFHFYPDADPGLRDNPTGGREQ